MGILEKTTKGITFPATLTTKNGVTGTLPDKEAYEAAGYGSMSWEYRRGAYFEVGCKPHRDKRVSVSAAASAAAEAAEKADPVILVEGDSPPPPPPPAAPSSKPGRRGRVRRSSEDAG